MMHTKLSKIPYTWLTALLWAVGCFVFFQGYYPYHFFYKEQNQLFLWTNNYFFSYFDKPAWLACWIGDFLTQFYYYLYAGSIILTVSLLLLMGTLYAALRKTGQKKGWAFAIAVVLTTLEAICHLRYDFGLSSTYAATGAALLFCHTPRKNFWIAILTPLAYWLFGYGAWLYLLFTAIRSWKWALPSGIVTAVMVYMLKGAFLLTTGQLYSYPGIGKLTMPNWYLEKLFQVDDEYYFGNWNKVVRLVEEEDSPTPEMLFFYNLVKAQQGQLPEVLLNYQPNVLGTFYQIGPDTPMLTIKNMNELYYALGDMTFCERAALMACVFSPNNRNNRMVKRLAECNLVKGDTAAAQKYLGLLEHTFVWGNWAKNANAKRNKHYAEKALFMNRQDTISVSDNAHFIMMQLLDSNPKNEVALDYILCSNLLLKDVKNFKRDYDRYCSDSLVSADSIRRLFASGWQPLRLLRRIGNSISRTRTSSKDLCSITNNAAVLSSETPTGIIMIKERHLRYEIPTHISHPHHPTHPLRLYADPFKGHQKRGITPYLS